MVQLIMAGQIMLLMETCECIIYVDNDHISALCIMYIKTNEYVMIMVLVVVCVHYVYAQLQ